jgi:two-component system cell cycle response regulator DivK
MAKKPKADQAAPAAAPAPVERGAGPLILIVDDFQDNREMYTQYLGFVGYRVAEAVDGQDALTKCAALLPDLVVMDLSLPGLDGWEATRRLKKDPLTARIPVIALTGHALAGHAEGAREAGCDAFVAKPCLPADLEKEIRRVLAEANQKKPGR